MYFTVSTTESKIVFNTGIMFIFVLILNNKIISFHLV